MERAQIGLPCFGPDGEQETKTMWAIKASDSYEASLRASLTLDDVANTRARSRSCPGEVIVK